MGYEQQPAIITTRPALDSLVERLRSLGWFAFDTEFVGEDRYKPEVCLIQVATDEIQALIDPLAGIDVLPVWELVADPSIRTVVHAGTEDLALCQIQTGRPAANVVDLQIAAGLIGLGYPTSLAKLTRTATGTRLHKSQTLTDWRRRPLEADQISYAVEDVIHLPAIHRFIHARLEALGRMAWAEMEFEELCIAAAKQTTNPTQLRRLKGAGSLNARELSIAEALLAERDQLAMELDRPARTVVRDHLIAELARRGWTDPHRIRSLRGLNLGMANIKRLAKVIETAKSQPAKDHPDLATEGDTNEEEVLLSVLSAVLRDYCNRNQISYSLLASKDDLRQIVRRRTRADEPNGNIHLCSGWRGKALGSLLEDVLSGQKALRVEGSDRKFRLRLDS